MVEGRNFPDFREEGALKVADGTANRIPSADEMVPFLPQGSCSLNPAFGFAHSSSVSPEGGVNQTTPHVQTPRRSGDHLVAPPSRRAQAKSREKRNAGEAKCEKRNHEITTLVHAVNLLRGAAWAPFRPMRKISNMRLAALLRAGQRMKFLLG